MKNIIKATRINDSSREVRITLIGSDLSSPTGTREYVLDDVAMLAGDGPSGLCITHGWLPGHIVDAISTVIGNDAKANEWMTQVTL